MSQYHYRHDLRNDQWIIEDVYRGMRDGFFIEAGATNGVNGSATYVLEQSFGWNGICVEPIPQQFERIKEYRRCAADNRCLWSTSGEQLEFLFFPEKSGRSGISDVNKNTELMADIHVKKTVLRAETVSLMDLLTQHNAPQIIHYCCFDVEGAEPAILHSFPLAGPYKILAVSIEGDRCDDILLAAGYRSVTNRFSESMFEKYFLSPEIDRFRTV